MRIKWFAAVTLVSALAAAPAAGAAEADADKAPAEPKDEVVCTYEQPVGSHVKKRVCTTRAQREDRAERDRQTMQKMGSGAPRAAQDAQSR